MSSRDEVKVAFEVKDVNDVDCLEVSFHDEDQQAKRINLNDDARYQTDLKEAFLLMSRLTVTNDLKICFVESEDKTSRRFWHMGRDMCYGAGR